MAEITATMVKELRDKTQAGMMEAKKILTEVNGDMDAAIRSLREKNSKLEVKEGRTSAEGLVEAYVNESSTLGSIIEINSETDFVARNQEFADLAKVLASHAAAYAKAKNIDELLDSPLSGTGAPARERLQASFAKLRENLIFKHFDVYLTETGTIDAYVHTGGQVGVLIELKGQGSEIKELAREIAMHISFSNPKYFKKDDVPVADVTQEREIVKTRTMNDPKNASKPPEILEKIIEGGLGNFYKANVLLEQSYIRDEKQTIGGLLKGKSEILRFKRFKIGEASS